MTVNESWDEEWSYSRKFMPEITGYIKKALASTGRPCAAIWEADQNEDMHHNTDLFAGFPNGDILRISVRVRRWSPKYYTRYAGEVTVRCFLALNGQLHKDGNGRVVGDTELQKMWDGWGDLTCYCLADKDDNRLATFFLGNTQKLREYTLAEAKKCGGWGTVETFADSGMIYRKWDIRREHVAHNTGCGFLCYEKDEIPGFTIVDYRIAEELKPN